MLVLSLMWFALGGYLTFYVEKQTARDIEEANVIFAAIKHSQQMGCFFFAVSTVLLIVVYVKG